MTVTSDALDMLAGDPVRERKPGDFHRHPTTGAPYVIVEKDGKRRKVMYGRPSSFGSALDNPFNLLKWKERQLLIGVGRLLEGDFVWDVDPDNRDQLDAVVSYAYDAAETSLAADRGTHIHLLLEQFDAGQGVDGLTVEAGERLGIPAELQYHIVQQWLEFRSRLGVTALAVEQTVVNDRWRLAGTLDRLDVTSTPILTAYGILDGAFVGDIKTGGLTVGSDGQPNFWVKYPVQLAAYVDAVPYDTDTDERDEWGLLADLHATRIDASPNPDIALIYHYDLARALAGEVVDWVAIPVNVQAGREGGDLCRAAADFGKRRDLFAMPAPTIAVPVSPVTVEQPAVDPQPDTASPPVTVSAADEDVRACPTCDGRGAREVDGHWFSCSTCGENGWVIETGHPVPAVTWGDYLTEWSRSVDRERLRRRVKQLVDIGPAAEKYLRQAWPEGVPTLKHPGHTDEQLEQILTAVRRVEAEVGAGWHPDDSPDPRSAKAIRRAVDAWAGRDPGTAWFAASLIATFEQCRNADATFEDLVSQFTIEQADRLHDAAQSTSHDWYSGENQ